MKADRILFTIALFLSSCNLSGWKKIDLKVFEIFTPRNWKYKPIRGIDSFAGEIVSDSVGLSFDYSPQGFASNLIPTEAEYLNVIWTFIYTRPEDAREIMNMPDGQKIIDFATERRKAVEKQLKVSGHRSDTTVIFTRGLQKKINQKPQPDYWVIVNDRKKTDTVPLYISSEIKQENFSVDTNGKYVTKTIWPKVPGKGITGIFVYKTDSDFTFNLNGRNLSAKNQQLALRVFKTIKFK